MARFLDFLSPVIGGASSIVGLIQDSAARQRALQQQQQALQQFGAANDADYQAMLGNNSRTLMGAAGAGGTALTNLGSNLGAANAAGGVYNSSAVGGSLALGQQATDTSLANLAAQNQYNAAHLHAQGQQALAQMQLGQANNAYGYANQDLQGSRAGFGQFLGALGQSNLLGSPGGSSYDPAYTQQQLDANGITDSQMGLGGGYGGGGGTAVQTGYAPVGTSQIQSLPSRMGGLIQTNLAALGANTGRTAIPSMNGTMNQGANLGGMAGGIGNGGVGQQGLGSNPFYQQPQPRTRNWWDINSPLGGR